MTLAYRGTPPTFWGMCCGDPVDTSVDVTFIELDEALLHGDYANDREHRRRIHQWLTGLWEAKDRRLAAMKA